MTPTLVRRCPRCRNEVRIGHTMRPSLEVVVDLEGLDPRGELEAVAGGRWTYTLHTVSDQLAVRGAFAISTRPAGTRPRQLVVAEHRCTEGDT